MICAQGSFVCNQRLFNQRIFWKWAAAFETGRRIKSTWTQNKGTVAGERALCQEKRKTNGRRATVVRLVHAGRHGESNCPAGKVSDLSSAKGPTVVRSKQIRDVMSNERSNREVTREAV